LASVCYYSVQNLTSYYLLAKNIRMTIYDTIMFPVALYDSLTLSRSMGKGASEQDAGDTRIMKSFIICVIH